MIQSRAELLQSGRELATKVENNLGLSSCAVPRSAVTCVVAYFRRTELLPVLEGWRAAITVGTNDGPLTGLSNR